MFGSTQIDAGDPNRLDGCGDAYSFLGIPWRAIKITGFERRQMAAVRRGLDQEFEAQTGLAKLPLNDQAKANLSGNPQT